MGCDVILNEAEVDGRFLVRRKKGLVPGGNPIGMVLLHLTQKHFFLLPLIVSHQMFQVVDVTGCQQLTLPIDIPGTSNLRTLCVAQTNLNPADLRLENSTADAWEK